MINVYSDKEFKLARNSFLINKKINLKDMGFNKVSSPNLYEYQSEEYKILNYSIKPKLIFLINFKDDEIFIKLQNISIKNLPIIFNSLKLNIEVSVFFEKEFCKIFRHISLRHEIKNNLIKSVSKKFTTKILKNLIDVISIRFDKKLIKKVSNAI